MTNDRDQIDAWLEREVTPLMPRAGSLDRIRRTARRRKTAQVVMTAAGCAVIIAAGVVVPQLTGAFGQHPAAGPSRNVQVSGQTPSVSPTASGPPTPAITKVKPLRAGSDTVRSFLSTTSSGYHVPADFRPTSVTFAPNGTGGVVGAVIGQGGDSHNPCASPYCTSLAGTSDYGGSWYGVSAPLTDGVTQLRFVDLKHGWAFGPQLWETSRGGWPWQPEDTYGLNVIALEGSGNRAFAIFASCSGTGADYASGCTSFSLYSSVAGSTTWAPVAVPASFRHMTAAVQSSAGLVVAGRIGYMLTPSGAILTGSVAGGPWKLAGIAKCQPGQAQVGGVPTGAQLAASPALLLTCDSYNNAGYHTTVWTSATGRTWKFAGTLNTVGQPTSLSVTPDGQPVLATTATIYYSGNHGATWNAAAVAAQPQAGGFSYIGMTNASQGVAVPADAALGEIFVTADGGRTWSASHVVG